LKKTSEKDKIIKAYGKSLPEDEIRSIMGRSIPPEWTVNLLALGKEAWRFKDLEDQLNMYRQQLQVDQQKQIIAKLAEKMPVKTNEEKLKNNERHHQNSNGGHSSTRQSNTSQGGRGGGGRGRGGRGRRNNNSEHLKNVECFNCGKKGHYSTDCSLPRKNDNEQSNMVSKSDFKKRISIFIEGNVDQKGQTSKEEGKR
jgi:hypothetical protein